MTSRNEIAIYAPFAHSFYEEPGQGPPGAPRGGGGAELQTALMARALAGNGLRVAHIIYPLDSPARRVEAPVELVQRPRPGGRRGRVGKLVEAIRIWRAMARADARLYVFRGGGAPLIAGAGFCFLRRRLLVLSASNDLDFDFDRADRSSLGLVLYRLALRRTARVIVQTARQLELATAAVGPRHRIALIPSFAEPAGDRLAESAGDRQESEPSEAFLWIGRLVEYKLPLRYIDLARSMPSARFRMIVSRTGETTAALSDAVAGEAAEVPNLELLTRRPRDEVQTLISKATAVVLTSRYEGMPNVFLEAWALEVPVLSLHFDPDGKIVDEGLGLFAEGSWERFVELARELWEKPRLREQIGARGPHYIAGVHSPQVVGARWSAELRLALR